MYVVYSIRFQTFFVQVFKIVVDSWKFIMLMLYILWDDGPIFLISGSNEQLQQELQYIILNPDCYSWWILKMQSGREEERYSIKFCFKLGKMPFDESWIYCYDPETKRQSSQWKHAGSPRPKKARQSKSTHEFLMMHFFDWVGMIYVHWVSLDRQSTRNTILMF